jgi:hypothetical protein
VGSSAVMTAAVASLVALMRCTAWQGCADHLPAATYMLQLSVLPVPAAQSASVDANSVGFGIHLYRSRSETRLRSQGQALGARRSSSFDSGAAGTHEIRKDGVKTWLGLQQLSSTIYIWDATYCAACYILLSCISDALLPRESNVR